MADKTTTGYKPPTEEERMLSNFELMHAPLIGHVIRSLRSKNQIPSSISDDELYEHGRHGMLEAFVNYDPSRVTNEQHGERAYMKQRIRGRILDHVNKTVSGGMIPKSIQREAAAVAKQHAVERSEPVQTTIVSPALAEETKTALSARSKELPKEGGRIQFGVGAPAKKPE